MVAENLAEEPLAGAGGAGLVIEFCAELFARGRATGEIRGDVTDEQMADWIRGMILMLILRSDLTRQEERAMIESFLLPSLGAP